MIAARLWTVDPARSTVGFRVKHLGFAAATGSFSRFEGRLDLRSSGDRVCGEGSVAVASVATGDEQRDAFLRSPDFFGAAQFPRISFSGSELRPSGENLSLAGTLTIRDVSRPVTLTVAETPREHAEGEDEVIRLRVAGEIARSEFGLRFNGPGNRLVGEAVSLELSLCLVASAPEDAAGG